MKKRIFKYRSVRKRLLISLLVLSLFMTGMVTFISYRLAEKRVESISMQLAKQLSGDWGSLLSDQFDALHNLSGELMQSQILSDLSHAKIGSTELSAYEQQLNRFVSSLLNEGVGAKTSFQYIHIYFADGRSYESRNNKMPQYDSYESCIQFFEAQGAELSGEEYTSPQWTSTDVAGEARHNLVYLRFIYEPITMEKKGIVVFGIQAKDINAIDFSASLSGQLLTKNGIFIPLGNSKPSTSPESGDMIVAAIKMNKVAGNSISYTDQNGMTQIVSYYSIPSFGGYLIVPFEFYESVRDSEMSEYFNSMIITAGVMVILVVILAILISHGLSKSVDALADFTHKIRDGQTDLRYEATTDDEIALLGNHINKMLDQIQHSNLLREEDLLEKQALKLELMQQQINPHLLYNTLDSVVWVLRQGRTEDATRLVYALSDFFRISLSKGSSRVEIQEELRLIQCYLDIQKLARKKSIAFNCDVEESLLSYPVMKLSLQPLVENSVIHGFDGYSNDGIITIIAKYVQDYVLIEVTDNGIGMTETEVGQINEVLQLSERPEEFRHFGLFNINRRIVRAYGSDYGLSVESAVSEYTTIRVKLPRTIPEKERG